MLFVGMSYSSFTKIASVEFIQQKTLIILLTLVIDVLRDYLPTIILSWFWLSAATVYHNLPNNICDARSNDDF